MTRRRQTFSKLTPLPQERDAAPQSRAQAPLTDSPAQDVLSLQRVMGNAALQRLVKNHSASETTGEPSRHGHGCGCAACSTVSRLVMPGVLQRDDEVVEETPAPSGSTTATAEATPPAPSTKEDLIKAFKPETLDQATDMTALAALTVVSTSLSATGVQ
jgi:hypothetical protein